MSKYNANMFAAIKDSLEKGSGESGFKDILRFETGNSYLGRLLPNVKNLDETFFHYFSFGWESLATGQYVTAVSPTTLGERCPINELRWKLYKSGNPKDEELAKRIKRSENWLVNFYVIDDPKTEANNGTVKILRYGKQLDKIIKDAVSGIDAEEFGPSVFDLSEKGNNFRITVDKNEGGYHTYVRSKFMSPGAIKGLTKGKIDEIYDSVFDLTNVYTIKTYAELQEMIDTHILCKSTTTVTVDRDFDEADNDLDEVLGGQDFDMGDEDEQVEEKPVKSSAKKEVEKDETDEDFDLEIAELVEGL